MIRALIGGAVALGLAIVVSAPSAEAGGKRYRRAVEPGVTLTEHPKARHYRRGPQVRGFVARRGGYSYSYEDSIDTYGLSVTRYGGTPYYNSPGFDRQTSGGPFDSGFFFDSGIGARGGDSPYMH